MSEGSVGVAFGYQGGRSNDSVESHSPKSNTRTYADWESAAGAVADHYGGDTLSRFRIERARLNIEGYKYIPDALAYCLSELSLPICVTDLGGATGEVGLAVLSAGKATSYVVVENQSLVDQMTARPLEAGVPGLTFSTQRPASCDIFFTSCTIPYIEDPMSTLRGGFASAKHYAVVARNSFAPTEIFRIQTSRLFHNGHGKIPPGYRDGDVRYAHRTAVESDIVDLAQETGFSLVRRFDDDSGVIPYKGIVYGGSLVFARTEA